MFKEEETQYCPMCEEWAEKYVQLRAENDLFRACHDNEQEKRRKYEQTLTEIKEIAEKSYRTLLAEKDCIKCDEFLEQILQKISECEVENEIK